MARGSGFKRPVLERVRTVHKPVPLDQRRGSIARVAMPAAPIEKFAYVRNRSLLNAIKTLDCQHCGARGPSDPAHSNQGAHGKGKGVKASDVYAAALCRADHNAIDQGSMLTHDERVTLWTNAWRKTVRELVKRGLWPANVEIPDIRVMN
jgi:hypothetical protein